MTNCTSSPVQNSTIEFWTSTIDSSGDPGDDLIKTACPWLYEYIQFSRMWSPQSFDQYHESIGLWLLSTVCARRVVFHFGSACYPSLYTLLIGRSSLSAKTTAMNIGKSVLQEVGLDSLLLPDTCTPQKMVNEMTYTLPNVFDQLPMAKKEMFLKRVAFAGQRSWCHDEFGGLISGMVQSASPLANFRSQLRRFDDGLDKFENGTLIRGTETVDRPYLALLAACTPADLARHVRKGSALWGDGFLPRFALVAAPNDYLKYGEFPEGERVIPEEIAYPLLEWHERLGHPRAEVNNGILVVTPCEPTRVDLTQEVRDAYKNRKREIDEVILTNPWQDLDGNYARLVPMTLRIAVLFAGFEGSSTVEIRHWDGARVITDRRFACLEPLYDNLMAMNRPSVIPEDKVIKLITEKGPINSREIQKSTHLNSKEVEVIIGALMKQGTIASERVGKTTFYHLVEPEPEDWRIRLPDD